MPGRNTVVAGPDQTFPSRPTAWNGLETLARTPIGITGCYTKPNYGLTQRNNLNNQKVTSFRGAKRRRNPGAKDFFVAPGSTMS